MLRFWTMTRVLRSYGWCLPLLVVLGCTKKDDPIPLPPEPSSTPAATTSEVAPDGSPSEAGATPPGPTATGTVPGTVGTVRTPVDAGKGNDGGPATGIPPFPKPPAGFPTTFPMPSGMPPIPTGLPSAFPFPTPKSS